MSNAGDIKKVLVTGGAGYVGSALIPELLRAGYEVTVLDLFMFGTDVFDDVKDSSGLKQVKGDLRNADLLREIIPGQDAVIHLACISNDPSFELDPDLGKSINYDCFPSLVEISKDNGVKRFVYASSSSVYGIKSEENVTEDLSLEPLTDYSKYKALCEDVLQGYASKEFVTLTLRPATVCGYAPRLRLDVIVNMLTSLAYHKGEISVFGGDQLRPNIHIRDMVDLYVNSLKWPSEKIAGKIYNAGYQNRTVSEIAEIIKSLVGPQVTIKTTETDDKRSYRVNSDKIAKELGFIAKHTIEEAVESLLSAFKAGKVPDALTSDCYSNIKTLKKIDLK